MGGPGLVTARASEAWPGARYHGLLGGELLGRAHSSTPDEDLTRPGAACIFTMPRDSDDAGYLNWAMMRIPPPLVVPDCLPMRSK